MKLKDAFDIEATGVGAELPPPPPPPQEASVRAARFAKIKLSGIRRPSVPYRLAAHD